ncbi:MAG: sulfatase-like hydrolase/transferase, partial [Planctomycetaceae bacterium]
GNDRPNVLLILTDDQGWGDIRSHGNERIDTPHLDRLAADGVRFERFFVDPLCAPTRAALLTGRYSLRTGVHGVTRAHETMRTEEVTIAELLKDAGYTTGCFGKWHNGRHYPNHPNGQGFDEFFGFCGGHWNNYFDTTLERNGEPVATNGFITDVLTDEAIAFVRRNRKRPFFCFVPFNTPHFPPQVPDGHFDKYVARGCDDKTATVYGMVENVDENVGRLLATLDELSLDERTIVLFLTDNGPNTDRDNGGMKGRKGSVHEGGVRVPLFVRWTGTIAAGTTIEPIAHHADLLPTLCELCGISLPENVTLDGRSLAPLLEDSEAAWPDRTLFTFKDTKPVPDGRQGAVRTPSYRAVRERGDWQLYDILHDPQQSQNVAKEHPRLVEELATAFDAKWREVAAAGFAPVPVPIGHPQRPSAVLPGHEALLHPAQGEGISYHGRAGWANDWIDNWTGAASYPAWPVEVTTAGRYEIVLRYCCPAENVGSMIRVEIGDATVRSTFTKAHAPPPITGPDRFPRPEVPEKEWKRLSLGTVALDEGRAELTLRTERITGGRMPQIKAVEVLPAD